MPEYLVGLDLGQARDYSALSIAQRSLPPLPPVDDWPVEYGYGDYGRYLRPVEPERGPASYLIRHLQRWKLGTSYPDVVADVASLVAAPSLREKALLVVDGTGVGPPVVDLLRAARLPCRLIAVTITGGTAVTAGGDEYHVPKRDLVSAVQMLLQTRRLRVAEALPEARTLTGELENFRVKISLAGHDSYGAGEDWRVGNHDDLVLSVALACWAGEYSAGEGFILPVSASVADMLSGRNWI